MSLYTSISNFAQRRMAHTNPNLTIQLKRAWSQLGRLAQNQVLFGFFCTEKITLLNMAKGCRLILLMLGVIMVADVTQQRATTLARVSIHLF